MVYLHEGRGLSEGLMRMDENKLREDLNALLPNGWRVVSLQLGRGVDPRLCLTMKLNLRTRIGSFFTEETHMFADSLRREVQRGHSAWCVEMMQGFEYCVGQGEGVCQVPRYCTLSLPLLRGVSARFQQQRILGMFKYLLQKAG